MRTHAALVRGVNVGGRNKLAMPHLRHAVGSLGHTEVATYMQSGNVVFAAPDAKADTSEIAHRIEDAVADQLGLRLQVLVVSTEELREVVEANPFSDEAEPKAVHAVVLPEAPGADGVGAVAAAVARAQARGSRDEAHVVARTLYLWTPEGFGRSLLVTELNRGGPRRTPASQGTARNWATVVALRRLLDD